MQQLEKQLEQLEAKHNTLTKNYSELDETHQALKMEVTTLREELGALKNHERSRDRSTANVFGPCFLDPFTTKGLFDGDGELQFG